jgi:hypothetical protein
MQQAESAAYERKSELLELARERAMEEAGVAEESAIEQAERELAEAKKTGDKEEILEKEKALKKAKINKEYDKKAAELEYNSELRNWEYQKIQAKISLATAIMNAVKSGFGAPWPLSLVMPGIQSAMAVASFAVQQQALADAKPIKPKYATGGIVPGNMTTGDQVNARLNSGEMILNEAQQKKLFDMANGNSTGKQSIMIHNVIELDGDVLYEKMSEASRNNRLKISDKSIVRY